MNGLTLPPAVRAFVGTREAQTDRVGRSSSQVLLYPDFVLKISGYSEESETEAVMLRWLKGRLNVPEVLCREVSDGKDYLVMTRLEGAMSCSEANMHLGTKLMERMADAIRALWSVPLEGCPRRAGLDEKLAQARRAVEAGEVDPLNAEPGTFGEGGFRDPEALLGWLEENRPPERTVFSHGDLSMPNVFLRGDGGVGFLDLGRSGAADPWQDIAICCRSLHHNFTGVYDGKRYEGLRWDELFSALELKPDPEEIRYYILLDELF